METCCKRVNVCQAQDQLIESCHACIRYLYIWVVDVEYRGWAAIGNNVFRVCSAPLSLAYLLALSIRLLPHLPGHSYNTLDLFALELLPIVGLRFLGSRHATICPPSRIGSHFPFVRHESSPCDEQSHNRLPFWWTLLLSLSFLLLSL